MRLALGAAHAIDLESRTVGYTDPEGDEHTLGYDRLVLAAGSVNKLLPIPGVAEHAHGFRGVPEALYLRDHIIRQIELAAATDDPEERAARCTFVVVGAGYTGTEVAAQGPLFTKAIAARHPELRDQKMRWLLLDVAKNGAARAVAPAVEGGRPGAARQGRRGPDGRLRRRGDPRGGAAQERRFRADADARVVRRRPAGPAGRGRRPADTKGRLITEPTLAVPGHPEVFACGDAAAVPDLTRPGEVTAMTAQHASRQGKLAGRNVAASLLGRPLRQYKHHDLGFVVDLGGWQAAANPLRVPLSGFPAKIVTRAYHLMAMPGNRIRTAVDWLLDAVLGRQTVQLGLVRSRHVPLDTDTPELPHAKPLEVVEKR